MLIIDILLTHVSFIQLDFCFRAVSSTPPHPFHHLLPQTWDPHVTREAAGFARFPGPPSSGHGGQLWRCWDGKQKSFLIKLYRMLVNWICISNSSNNNLNYAEKDTLCWTTIKWSFWKFWSSFISIEYIKTKSLVQPVGKKNIYIAVKQCLSSWTWTVIYTLKLKGK